MNKLAIVAVVALTLSASTVWAENQEVTLTVSGQIIPESCEFKAVNGSTITVSSHLGELAEGGTFLVKPSNTPIQMSINCPTGTDRAVGVAVAPSMNGAPVMGLPSHGNMQTSAYSYALGVVSDASGTSVDLGAWSLRVSDARIKASVGDSSVASVLVKTQVSNLNEGFANKGVAFNLHEHDGQVGMIAFAKNSNADKADAANQITFNVAPLISLNQKDVLSSVVTGVVSYKPTVTMNLVYY